MSEDSKNEVKNAVLTENTAQSVYKHLRELESNRAHVVSRWIWELLQNARDASSGDRQLDVSIERRSKEVTFLHNGRGFREKEIAHLIYHGSTKSDEISSLGQFGSGFLTTHLLSPQIDVSGKLDDGRLFDFKLVRQADSPPALRDSMEAALEGAWESFGRPHVQEGLGDFSTRFRYPIITEEANNVVTEGLKTLRYCAPLVLVFNPQFHRIYVDDQARVTEFAVIRRQPFPGTEITEVTVAQSREGTTVEGRYLFIEGKDVAIALQTETNREGGKRCIPPCGPRLYLGFPLVGTDAFSLPTVANSFNFGPTEPRDGIYLGQAEDEVNLDNERLIEAAFSLHVELIRFATANGYTNSPILATIPPIKEQSWLNAEWLQKAIREKLIGSLRKTPSVATGHGEPLAPDAAILPYANEEGQVLVLRNLLEGMKRFSTLLPSSGEAPPWCNALKSWAAFAHADQVVAGRREGALLLQLQRLRKASGTPTEGTMSSEDAVIFGEAWDGPKLAVEVDEKTKVSDKGYGSLENLCALLVDPDGSVEWLNELCAFLIHNGLRTFSELGTSFLIKRNFLTSFRICTATLALTRS